MTNTTYDGNDVFEMETDETMEWVRGNDIELVARLTPAVREQSLVLDFSRVERIDAAGLAALISLYRVAHEAGYSFAVRDPKPHVCEILALVGLDRVLLVSSGERRPDYDPQLECTAA